VIEPLVIFGCLVGNAPWRHIDFAAKDWFDACLSCLFVKRGRTKHGSVVCDGHGIHVIALAAVQESIESNCSVQKGKLRVDVEVVEWC